MKDEEFEAFCQDHSNHLVKLFFPQLQGKTMAKQHFIISNVNGPTLMLGDEEGFPVNKYTDTFDWIQAVIRNRAGYHVGNNLPVNIPLDYLVRFLEDFKSIGVRASWKTELFSILEAHFKSHKERIDKIAKTGEVEFEDLYFVFETGDEVIGKLNGETLGGEVVDVSVQSSFFSPPKMKIQTKIIHSLNGVPQEGIVAFYIPIYAGRAKLDMLPCRKITQTEKDLLSTRGELFRTLSTRAAYMGYSGQLTRSSWAGEKSYRSDGRVMVDSAGFKQLDSDQHDREARELGLPGRDDDQKEESMVIQDDMLWKTLPYVWGFSFASKQWGRMKINGISAIKWRDHAFDQLVMEEEEKRLVEALVEHQGASFSDIVEGKGGGTIFLLHGPPGQGKTLTAETVAEKLKRPLYAISVGELGVNPTELESALREILDVATMWNAVLLLDEADIFLEERDEKDVVRNAMVGVFLRLLEYHQGVLFLTTNRVKQIDRAFFSRISIALSFPEGTSSKREKIWTNLLEAAQLKGLDVHELSRHELNGRQIKNVIRLSQTLAKANGESISLTTINKVVELTTRFNKDKAA